VAREFQRQGWAVDVARTQGPGHGTELAVQAARDGATRVVAMGGDGTVHEVANGLLRHDAAVPLGVVPVGSGNDFAKLAGVYGHGAVRAVQRLVTAQPRRFDVGQVLGEWFVNSMGLGFGPEVVRVRNAMPGLTGFLSYLIPVFRAYAGFRAPRLELRSTECAESGYMMMVEVCNGTTAGGNYRFAPHADPSDGRLDVCLVRRVSLPRFLIAVPRVMRGTHGRMREVVMFQTSELTIRSPERPLLLHVDGELREPGVSHCTVRVAARRLHVLVAR
jgi:YegS/Rv2252/BmrU family lipid kinase